MPGGREKPLHLQSTTDLWLGILGVPAFGSFFVALPLLCGPPVGGTWWTTLWLELLFVGFFTLGGVLGGVLRVGGVSRLGELRRRGAWVPPGTVRWPVLVSIALVLLTLATGAAFISIGMGVTKLASAAGMQATYSGLLGSAVMFSLVGATILVLRRLARRPPASEGSGTTEPGSPADRPPEQA